MSLFHSQGVIKASDNRLVVDTEDDLGEYYRKLIPKYLSKPNPQFYPSHISIIRKELRRFTYNELRKYDGELVEFFYENIVRNSETYWWIDIYSKRLEQIRKELDLTLVPRYPIDEQRRMNGYLWRFHLTIGNNKG